MKNKISFILASSIIVGLLLSACGLPATATPTDVVQAVYTAAAQTMAANAAKASATPKPSETPKASNTPIATAVVNVSPSSSAPTSRPLNFCDNAAYVADVTIPDNSIIAPGQVFDKTWTVKNTGSCNWTEGYTIVFVNGDLMGGTTRPVGLAVATLQQANVTVKLTAPNIPGKYTGVWRLANGKGAMFGEVLSVVITVSGSGTTTVTPTATATGPTSTSDPTSTTGPTKTATTIPTKTATSVHTTTATMVATPTPPALELPTATDNPTATPTEASTTPP